MERPVIRPIRPEDAAALARLFERLSPETVYRRFHQPMRRPRPAMLAYFANVDHRRRDALVAEVDGEIVAVASYDVPSNGDGHEAEIAVLVEDAWQRHGLGRRLVRRLAKAAAERGVDSFTAYMLGDNPGAVRLLRSLAPKAPVRPDHGELVAHIPLRLAG
ncbi:MAG TPA: GNAT family N-acetyltransferase [Acidimicrobiales bacterium]|nr:GNAT family N-acetyltransferase [Acidimicrobiales bacterium]